MVTMGTVAVTLCGHERRRIALGHDDVDPGVDEARATSAGNRSGFPSA